MKWNENRRRLERLNRFFFQFSPETNEYHHMFQSIMKIKRPFLTDDLCLKVALMLNYVPVTQNIKKLNEILSTSLAFKKPKIF